LKGTNAGLNDGDRGTTAKATWGVDSRDINRVKHLGKKWWWVMANGVTANERVRTTKKQR